MLASHILSRIPTKTIQFTMVSVLQNVQTTLISLSNWKFLIITALKELLLSKENLWPMDHFKLVSLCKMICSVNLMEFNLETHPKLLVDTLLKSLDGAKITTETNGLSKTHGEMDGVWKDTSTFMLTNVIFHLMLKEELLTGQLSLSNLDQHQTLILERLMVTALTWMNSTSVSHAKKVSLWTQTMFVLRMVVEDLLNFSRHAPTEEDGNAVLDHAIK